PRATEVDSISTDGICSACAVWAIAGAPPANTAIDAAAVRAIKRMTEISFASGAEISPALACERFPSPRYQPAKILIKIRSVGPGDIDLSQSTPSSAPMAR